jgi:hypothetical protein
VNGYMYKLQREVWRLVLTNHAPPVILCVSYRLQEAWESL